MTNEVGTLVHVLAVDDPDQGRINVRGTIRLGGVSEGDDLWFETGDCQSRCLTVLSLQHTPRWSVIVLSGPQADLERIGNGTFMHRHPPSRSAKARSSGFAKRVHSTETSSG